MGVKVEQRNRAVLDAAVALAEERGFRNYSRLHVAERAGVSCGSVNNAFGTMDGLHDRVMEEAVARNLTAIIAQGLVVQHPAALAASSEAREAAARSIADAAA